MILGIYGTGGSGKELLEMVERFDELLSRWDDIVFIDDTKPIGSDRSRRRLPLKDFAKAYSPDEAEVVIAVGEPYYRMLMANKVRTFGFVLATIINPHAYVSPSAKIGKGVVIRVGSVISADAEVGDNTWIQTYVTIGHDAQVGSNCQISSYVMLAGAVKVGRNVFIGISAAIKEDVEIGDDAIVSMGAMVMRSVLSRQVVSGNPAEVLMMNGSRLVFKRAYSSVSESDPRLARVGDSSIATSQSLREPSGEIVACVKRVLARALPNVDFSRSKTMGDDGLLDSISMARIITALKAEFDIEIPYELITPASFNSLETIARLVEDCQENGAELKFTFVESFQRNVERGPDKFCLGGAGESLTYRDVWNRVCNAAARLRAREIVVGDKVVISAVAKPDYVVALMAVQMLGAVTIPVDKTIKEDNLRALVDYVRPKVVLSAADLASLTHQDGVSTFVPDNTIVASDALAEMLFTTGTTGIPKGAMLAHNGIRGIIRNTWNGVGMRSDDVVLIPLPLNHSVGMRVLRTALSIGAGVVVQNGFAFAEETERNISTYGCTAMVCVPTAADALRLQMGTRFTKILGKLRYIEFGAGSVSVPMKRQLVKELPGVKLFNTWGSSETGGAIFLEFSARLDKADTVGRPVNGVTVGTVDENGNLGLAANAKTAGRLALKGDMRMLGYYNLPEATSQAIRDDWLVTNDLAYVDEDGFVHLLGRADDIINVGGEKVAPVTIENVAIEYVGVKECACIGVPDSLLGQVPKLFYVTGEADFDENGFMEFLVEHLERYQVPKTIARLDAMPRNSLSKLDRRALMQL